MTAQHHNVETFTVLAAIDVVGDFEPANLPEDKPFSNINNAYSHALMRYLVVTRSCMDGIYVLDLWNTEVLPAWPYVSPWFVANNKKFESVEHALIWLTLTK